MRWRSRNVQVAAELAAAVPVVGAAVARAAERAELAAQEAGAEREARAEQEAGAGREVPAARAGPEARAEPVAGAGREARAAEPAAEGSRILSTTAPITIPTINRGPLFRSCLPRWPPISKFWPRSPKEPVAFPFSIPMTCSAGSNALAVSRASFTWWATCRRKRRRAAATR